MCAEVNTEVSDDCARAGVTLADSSRIRAARIRGKVSGVASQLSHLSALCVS